MVSPCLRKVRAPVRPWSSPLASSVHPALLGDCNVGGLTILGMVQFDFSDAKKQTRNQIPHRGTEVDLLGDGDNPHATLAEAEPRVNVRLRVKTRRGIVSGSPIGG